jgi:hypothetical protein
MTHKLSTSRLITERLKQNRETTDDNGRNPTAKSLCNGGVLCPHNFRFLYLHRVVGQVATGRA